MKPQTARLLTGLSALAIFFYAAQSTATEFVHVVDENNQPVANATVMLGYEPGNPFQGNTFNTDTQGAAQIPDDWKAALPITVQAPGFITNTIPTAMPGVQTLVLTHQEPQSSIEVKGTTTDYGRLVTDGKVDFGLVIPAISRSQILSFDISSVISPRNDSIEIIGNKVDVPSNITLPNQRETYVFPITLDKPDYRLYLRQPGQYKLGVTHGQFPLQRVVNEIRAGKSFLEVVNYFDFKELGQKTLDVQGDLGGMDMAVNQIAFNSSFAVKAPAFDPKLAMMSLAVVEADGVFLPTDVKRFTPGQSLNLKTNTSAGQPAAFSLLMENANAAIADATRILRQWFSPLADMPKFYQGNAQNFNKLSFVLQESPNGITPNFLPLIERPTLQGQVLHFDVPALPAGLSANAMYMTLSEIETLSDGQVTVERRTRVWELLSDAWVDQMELPKVEIQRRSDRKYRWEVLFMARPSNIIDVASPRMGIDLKTITHATRNTLDI